MITAICGSERNVGRTTVATNLAAMLAQCGKDVLLIDASKNEQASDFTIYHHAKTRRGGDYVCFSATKPETLTSIIDRLAPRFNEVVIDTSSETALVAASKCKACVVVASPNWKFSGQDEELIASARNVNPNLNCYVVFNRCYPGFDPGEWDFSLTDETWNALSFVLSNGKAFTSQFGLAVTEAEVKNRRAVEEATEIYEELYDEFNPKPQSEAAKLQSTVYRTVYRLQIVDLTETGESELSKQ